jgi:hypothetical protein
MPKYRITTPDGKTYEVIAPEGTTKEEALAYAQQHHAQAQQYTGSDQPAAIGTSLPGGQQMLGPGPGTPMPVDQTQDIMRQAYADPMTDLASGAIHGPVATAVGIAQLGAHALPGMMLVNRSLEQRGMTSPRSFMDDMASRLRQNWEADPASQSAAGQAGDVAGGLAATAPLAALSIPGKASGTLSALGRSAVAGGTVAMTQPVDGENFAMDKFKQATAGAAYGAGLTGASRAAMRTGEALFGPNYLAEIANAANKGANRSVYAAEGEGLSQRTGVRLTPGQVSGSKVQTALENMSRQSVFSADTAFQADKRIADDAVRYVDKLANNITQNPASEAAIGTQIQTVTRAAVEKIASQREKVAAQQYGAIDAALGGRPFVQPTNAMAEADKIIAEYGSVAGPEAARIVRQAEALKEQLKQKQAYTFQEAQRSRSYYGRGARGASNVFDDVNPDINRRIATRLFRAFDADMEQSATRLGGGTTPGLVAPGQAQGIPGLADAIKQANANYRRYSQLIEATKAHPIARLFGENINIDDVVVFDKIAPEVVIKRLGQMHPSELRQVRDFMHNNAPEAWQQYKRLMVDRALDSARTLPTSAGANTVPFNSALFMRALGGDKPDKIRQLQAIYSADELKQIDDAFALARRMGDRTGYNSSGTGPYNEVQNFLRSIRDRSAQAVASTAGEVLGLRKIANVMLNADGRRALIQLSQLPPKSRQAASLVAFLGSLIAGQHVGYPSDQHGENKNKPQNPRNN